MRPGPLAMLAVLVPGALLGTADAAMACTRTSPIGFRDLFNADAIVRVTALRYDVPPDPGPRPLYLAEATIEFGVEEVLWGSDVPRTIVVPGDLRGRDDFNDVPLPYRFVRPGGRSGNCHATLYRQGGQYLLFLRKEPDRYTPYWMALGPTSEQVRGADDPWIRWVRAYLSPCVSPGGGGIDLGAMTRAEMEALEDRLGTAGDLDRYRLARCYLSRFGTDGERGKRHMRLVESYEVPPGRD